jgi:hypothetical protein
LPTDEEKMKSTKSLLFFGNFMIAIWIALGTAVCWSFGSLSGWGFLLFSTFSVFILIRRQMCSSCYYCNSCTKGFAKMSKLFLGGNNIPGVNRGSTIGMTIFIYATLSIIPGALLISSIIQDFTQLKLLLLIGILSIPTIQATIRAKKWYDPLFNH